MKLISATMLLLGAVGLAACSSGPTHATKDALAACQALVNLGNELSTTHGGVKGSDIEAQLESGRLDAARAAHENVNRWTQLSQDVGSFVTTLEAGGNASRAEIQAIEDDCAPFVPPPPTT